MKKFLSSLSLLLSSIVLPAQPDVELQPIAYELGFLVDISNAGDDRLFCLTQNGLIHIVQDGSVLPEPFLDITGQTWGSGELGSLGLAFDPDYASNGYFYVHYTALTEFVHTRISRFQVSSDPNIADISTEQILWTYPHPSNIHKGGDLKFGPDGMLYFSLGDGAFPVNGQDLTEPLASILRIDVSALDSTFLIPPDNPFANAVDTVQEVWAFGLRNPWRMSFDKLTGDLWFGDVGAQEWEEINLIAAGDNSAPNFGWRCFEGLFPVPDVPDCGPASEYKQPIIVHPHSEGYCAIIGGRVYRGIDHPALYGRYLYTDLCAGVIRSLLPDSSGGWISQELASDLPFGLTCFGEDHEGELYLGHQGGTLYRLIDPLITSLDDEDPPSFIIHPNPAQDRISISAVPTSGSQIQVIDAAGRIMIDRRTIGSGTIELDLSEISNGIYLLLLKDPSGDRIHQRSFVVDR